MSVAIADKARMDCGGCRGRVSSAFFSIDVGGLPEEVLKKYSIFRLFKIIGEDKKNDYEDSTSK